MRLRSLRAILPAIALAAVAAAPAADPGYHVINTFQVGGPGGWDYVALDSVANAEVRDWS